MPETPQLLPSRNQYDKVKTAADGSVELWFAPKKPEGVDEKNWIQSIPGRAQFVAIRLYGAGTESTTRPGSRMTWSRSSKGIELNLFIMEDRVSAEPLA
jgi:hypothetical protein